MGGVARDARRLKMPAVAMFLHDADQLIVLEAARAINDVPINDAMPQLAALIDRPTQSEPLDWRVVNANFRVGTGRDALALADYAAQSSATEKVRGEALHALETWAAPGPRDRITGFWRPLPGRDGKPAADALAPDFNKIMADAPEGVQLAAIHAAQKLSLTSASPRLLELASNTNAEGKIRVASLEALGDFHDSHLQEAVQMSMTDHDETVREAGDKIAGANPIRAMRSEALAGILRMGVP